jgi:hypothetical protein
MLRRCSCTSFAVMLVGLSIAQAADTTLTLACQGTATETMMEEEKKPEPISMGIIVNFTNSTVQGFGSPDPKYGEDFPVKITGANEVTISFQGVKPDGPTAVINKRIDGSIDRVTGAVDAYSTSTNLKTSKIVYSTRYALKCRPAQRMF